MKKIQHEETGYIAEISENVPIPSGWYEIKGTKNCDETKTDTPILTTLDGNNEIWVDIGGVIGIEGQDGLTVVISDNNAHETEQNPPRQVSWLN